MIDVRCNLQSPDKSNDTISRIVEGLSPDIISIKRNHYWPAEAFGLHNSDLYNALTEYDQYKVLALISDSLLREAYFIEKAGIAFAAKMTLLSETTEERELYSHFSHQEANHLSMLKPFLKSTEYGYSYFLNMLTGMIETGDKQPLTYVIQVLLEGYGLSHYNQLSKSCIEPTLSDVFNKILKDEGAHYRSGTSLFDPESLTDSQRLWIDNAVYQFEKHVSKGPTHVVDAVTSMYAAVGVETYHQLLRDIKASEQIGLAIQVFNRLKVEL